jgi:hypothetical protein
MCLEGERLSCYLPAKLEKTMPNRLINKTAIISGGVEAFAAEGLLSAISPSMCLGERFASRRAEIVALWKLGELRHATCRTMDC